MRFRRLRTRTQKATRGLEDHFGRNDGVKARDGDREPFAEGRCGCE